MKRLRKPLALALGIAALGIAIGVGSAAPPYFPAPRANITMAKATRQVHVGHSSRASDFMTLAGAYTWLNDQTRDATHQWVVLVDADADITSPGTKPTFTSVVYQANIASTAAACSNGQVQTYVSATNTWSCGSATTGGVAGAGTTVASALASFTDTGGGSIQAAGTATIAANPALGVSGLALGTTGIIAEGATADAIETLLVFADPAGSDKTVTVPAVTGTLATGAASSIASALVSFTDTSGTALAATGAATLVGDPGLGASGLALGTTGLIFEGATADTSEGLLVAADATADRTWTLPDVSGTVGMGPGAATDLALARWDGTGGALLQDSTLTLSDVGALSSSATVGADPALGANGVTFGTTGLIAEGSTANGIETLLTFADPAASDKTVTVPAATGTLALATGFPATATFAAAAGGADVAEITITIVDQGGVTVAAVGHMDVWLSDAATCAGLTGTVASGTVQAKAASGVDLVVYTAKKAMRVQSLATGVYILEVTDSAKSPFFVCAAPAGKAAASAQLIAGNYG